MRKLIFGINLTIDGCCDHTKGVPDEESHDFWTKLLLNTDTLVYGRKTYQLMVPFWPEMAREKSGPTRSMNDFANAFASMKEIVVFSRSLSGVDEKNARIARADLKDEILKLKQQDGKSILAGGVDVPSQLIDLELVDEYVFVIQPLLVGQGRRLLENYSLDERLRLIDTKILKSGSIVARYSKA
ncbi:dihydrofolate reductase family protein [Chryseolinea sp. T2]|uniref:dihydrofolate reductase family protein n=1 Tax=Chryseolinea sp. T2 TaxID=3129255 RepID=UPI0030786000